MSDLRDKKLRHWVFTSYKVSEPIPFDESKFRYIIYQKERCPTSGREHYQGYCELKSPQRISFIKTAFNDNGLHLEIRKGSRDEAREYCRKKESHIDGPWEHGKWESGGQGQRNDVREQACIVRDLVRENPKEYRTILAEEHPEILLKYPRGVEVIRASLEVKERTWTTECELYIGKPGTGKSTKVRELYPDAFWYSASTNGWWDGYEGEDVVVFDEFKGSLQHSIFTQLIGNSYKVNVNVKGGVRGFVAKKVIIISNYCPMFWYKEEFSFRAISRRLSKILYFRNSEIRGTREVTLDIEEFTHTDDEHAFDQWRRRANEDFF